MSSVEGLVFFISSVHITRPASLITLISLPRQWLAKNNNYSSHWLVLSSGTWMQGSWVRISLGAWVYFVCCIFLCR